MADDPDETQDRFAPLDEVPVPALARSHHAEARRGHGAFHWQTSPATRDVGRWRSRRPPWWPCWWRASSPGPETTGTTSRSPPAAPRGSAIYPRSTIRCSALPPCSISQRSTCSRLRRAPDRGSRVIPRPYNLTWQQDGYEVVVCIRVRSFGRHDGPRREQVTLSDGRVASVQYRAAVTADVGIDDGRLNQCSGFWLSVRPVPTPSGPVSPSDPAACGADRAGGGDPHPRRPRVRSPCPTSSGEMSSPRRTPWRGQG